MAFKAIPVTAAQVAATLSDFPVYIKPSAITGLGSLTLAQVESMRWYADEAKTIELASQPVSADQIYVKVPTLTTSTVLYVDYDGVRSKYAETDTYGSQNVWTVYEAVWHLEEDPSGTAPQIKDSTGNNYDLSSNGTMTTSDSVSATLGNGINFDGSNDYLSKSGVDPYSGSTGEKFWISAIVSGIPSGEDSTIVAFGRFFSLGTFGGDLIIVTNGDNSGVGTVPIDNGNTFFVTGYFNQGNEYRLYKDGVQTVQKNTTDREASSGSLFVGEMQSNPRIFDGVMDELRWAKTDLGSAWEETYYNNVKFPGTFFGTVTDVSTARRRVFIIS